MKRRCHDPKSTSYPRYGARGIEVFQAWREDFSAFKAYLDSAIGPRPSEKHTLDRIDNDRGYEPGNLRWATRKQQRENQ